MMSSVDHSISSNTCELPDCAAAAPLRCSRCKTTYYCSVSHQKENWKDHRLLCKPSFSIQKGMNTKTVAQAQTTEAPVNESKECRCMFCGLSAVYTSEEEAIAHMQICPALQEQLNDRDNPFTLPKDMR